MKMMKNQMLKIRTAMTLKMLEAKAKLRETSGEGYVDTAIKILIAVVLGALLFNDTVLPTLVDRVKEMFDYGG